MHDGRPLLSSTVFVATVVAAAVLGAGCHDTTTLSSTSGSAGETAVVATDGVVFNDPQGTYTIDIGSDWTPTTRTPVKEIEAWTLGPAENGFATNVNVLTQDAPNLDLAGYMAVSVANMGGFELIDHGVVTGSDGNDLGLLEYTGFMTGASSSRPLHFLAIIDVAHEQAIVATLTVDEQSFAATRLDVEPYLLTLHAT